MKTSYQTKWIFSDSLGIFLGLALAAGIVIFEAELIGEPSGLTGRLSNVGIAIVGGLLAGTIVAGFQWRALHQRYEGLSWFRWWRNTVLAFTAGWLLAIVPSLSYTGENAMNQVIAPFGIPTYASMYGSILFGGLMGGLIGFAQNLELRKHQSGITQWIGMNVFGWAAGFFVMTIIGLVLTSPAPLTMFLLAGLGGALITALTVAGMTSMCLDGKVEAGS